MLLRSASRARSIASQVWRWVLATVAAGALLAVLGPFGSYLNPGLAARFGYWIGAMLAGLLLGGAAFLAGRRIAPPGSRWAWPVLIAATLLVCALLACLTHVAAFHLWPELARLHLSWPVWFAQNAVIGFVYMAAAAFLQLRTAHRKVDPPLPLPNPAVLPAGVLALQMEDHYVRVHTAQGSKLLLMPLSRAVQQIAAEGLRVHRSWWVARHAVTAVEGTPRSMRVRLCNGVVAPVARSAVVYLKEAGWLD